MLVGRSRARQAREKASRLIKSAARSACSSARRSSPPARSSAGSGDRNADQRQHCIDVGVREVDRIEQCRYLLLDGVGAMSPAVATGRSRDVADAPDAVAGVAAVVAVALRAAQEAHQRIAAGG